MHRVGCCEREEKKEFDSVNNYTARGVLCTQRDDDHQCRKCTGEHHLCRIRYMYLITAWVGREVRTFLSFRSTCLVSQLEMRWKLFIDQIVY
ncbi:hypothetical protein T07_15007 [Trichinella nelsoni]|uniref:Uncharacterized protein n=1 Tax=Trichinella nelsoni TaxID=6336 RepID=A0A0V0S9M5_9BILA|nr:hypothetical protein T07_15007 [Trichinella nelsoni]